MTGSRARSLRNHATALLFLWIAAGPAGAQVEQIVRNVYYHGIPYEMAHGLGPGAVPTLLDMLEREEERPHWSNIVTVLGMIGDDRATEPLIDFLEQRFEGPVDDDTYRALLEVPTSLGFLARDPSSRAFAYLRDATSPNAFADRRLRWTFQNVEDEGRDLLVVRRSISGLGITATEAAREHLRSMERMPDYSRLRPLVESNVVEALGISERIESLGYESVFSEEHRKANEQPFSREDR